MILGILSFVFLATAHADTPTVAAPKEKHTVYVTPDHMFVPPGYDSTDVNVEVGLVGTLPNNCFELAGSPVVDHSRLDQGIIVLRQRAIYKPKLICTQISEPYLQIANLGAEIPAGNYQIIVESSEKPTEPFTTAMTIAETETGDIDNFHYLNIQDAFLTKKTVETVGQSEEETLLEDPKNKIKRFLNLRGEHRNVCVSLRDVDIKVFLKERIIQVLPIVDLNQDPSCAKKVAEVVFSGELPKLPEGQYLVHIRSAFGKSKNVLVDF
ncbi:MAG TPA: hypothetical protein PLH57_09130 [Oligoflexia bacterium]|nr:hypothetical protein [Oligoflexia bacterium]